MTLSALIFGAADWILQKAFFGDSPQAQTADLRTERESGRLIPAFMEL
jgi:hypothetical protein